MPDFRAVIIRKNEGGEGQSASFGSLSEADLMEGDVTLRVLRSTVNYKDGLAVTGRAPVVRRFPMVPGVDGVGVVEASESSLFAPGDKVLINGWGIGETHLGAWAERARWKSDWLLPLPAGFSADEAMAIGTAGYTAMLAIMALERHDIRPGTGPVLVTGASGGVGSIAVSLLASLGHHVVASTGRMDEADYLAELGAAEVIARETLAGPPRALARERFIGAIDAVGGVTLANVLSQIRAHGAVAACGNAGGLDLPASVAPFILRGIALYGIDSVYMPKSVRLAAWERLDRDLDRDKLAHATRRIPFEGAIDAAKQIVEGKVRGRLVVEIG